jgi:hypothetical protein
VNVCPLYKASFDIVNTGTPPIDTVVVDGIPLVVFIAV